MNTSVQPHALPYALIERDQWVVWLPEERQGKVTKVPYQPSGRRAAADAPHTWSTFAEVFSAARASSGRAGVGFVFSEHDPYCGVDLDGVVEPHPGVGGTVVDWAAAMLDDLCSYTEVTPSGTGLHVIVKATLPPGRRRTGKVEMYDRGRFFTVTGRHLWGTPWGIKARQAEVRDLHRRLFPATSGAMHRDVPVLPGYRDDDEVVERATKARNGDKVARLLAGDIVGYKSPSEADLALTALLAYWTQDDQQIERIIARSGLGREKWERRDRYRETTIAKARTRG